MNPTRYYYIGVHINFVRRNGLRVTPSSYHSPATAKVRSPSAYITLYTIHPHTYTYKCACECVCVYFVMCVRTYHIIQQHIPNRLYIPRACGGCGVYVQREPREVYDRTTSFHYILPRCHRQYVYTYHIIIVWFFSFFLSFLSARDYIDKYYVYVYMCYLSILLSLGHSLVRTYLSHSVCLSLYYRLFLSPLNPIVV